MAHRAASRPDPFDPSGSTDALPENGRRDGDDGSLDLASALFAHGAGTSAVDLALDLVLNEIAQQARLTTNATGAAIALSRGGAIVGRATSGATAPEVAALLNTRTGLAGACLRTGKAQRCADTETNSQVDGVACRRLGARSIVVVPVQEKDEAPLGVIEIFAPRPDAFGDRDVLMLEAFSRRILANIELSRKVMTLAPAALLAAAPGADPPRPKLRVPQLEFHVPQVKVQVPQFQFHLPRLKFHVRQLEFHVPKLKFHLPQIKFHVRQLEFHLPKPRFHLPQVKFHVRETEFHLPQIRFHLPQLRLHVFHVPFPVPRLGFGSGSRGGNAWTRNGMLALTALVITLALLVGWMLGWGAGRGRAAVAGQGKSEMRTAAPASQNQPLQAAPPAADSVAPAATENSLPKPQLEAAISQPKAVRKNAPPAAPIQLSSSKVKITKAGSPTDKTLPGGLVIYENGKVVFRMEPTKPPAEPAKGPTAQR
jgi:hypothetical protein